VSDLILVAVVKVCDIEQKSETYLTVKYYLAHVNHTLYKTTKVVFCSEVLLDTLDKHLGQHIISGTSRIYVESGNFE
jgi:hypothetical protein